MMEEKKFSLYIEATIESMRRTRFVFFFLIVSVVLILTTYWNSRSETFLNSRIRIYQSALRWFDLPEDLTRHDLDEIAREKGEESLTEEDYSYYKTAKVFVSHKGNPSKAQLRESLMALEKIRIENITFLKTPFYGVAFDIADLGLFGGVALFLISAVLWRSLTMELSNLKLTFEKAVQENESRSSHELLMMRQFLIPPYHSKVITQVLWGGMVVIIISLPLITHFIVVAEEFWLWIYWGSTFASYRLICNAIFLFSIVFLTYRCISLVRKVNLEFASQSLKLVTLGKISKPNVKVNSKKKVESPNPLREVKKNTNHLLLCFY